MAGAGEAIGGIAGAVPGTLEIPIKIAGEVRAWKEFQARLKEGGVIDEFVPQNGLLEGEEQRVADAIRNKYNLGDMVTVSVAFKMEREGHRIIGFRAPNSNAKLALRVDWKYYFAHVEVRAAEDLTKTIKKTGKTSIVKAGELLHVNPHFGGFINNVAVRVHNSTHIKGGNHAFTVGGSVEQRTETGPGQVTHIVELALSLNPHTTKRDFSGATNLGRSPRQFKFTISGNKAITYSDEEGNTLEVPRVAPAPGEHFTEAEIIALQKSAALENQGVLFSLNKGKGKTVKVFAIPAKDLKVRTDTKSEAPAPATVRSLDTIVVVGPHTEVLTDYLKDKPGCVAGTLRYSSLRGHGTWTFAGVGALSDGIEKQVKAQFEYGELRGTKKTIKFE